MAREQLRQARSLIKKKRFDEARALLNTIDHPQARKWLAEIDKQQPPKASRRGGGLRSVLAFLLTIIVSVLLTSALIAVMVFVTAPSRGEHTLIRATQAVLDVTETAVAALPTETPFPSATPITGVVTGGQNVNVRSDPSINSDAIALLQPGTRVALIDTNDDESWYHIRMANGQDGWVNASFLNPEGQVPTAVAEVPTDTPTPSEVCSEAEAQAWYDENRWFIMEINFVMYQFSVSRDRGVNYDVQAGLDRLRENRDAFEANEGPPCVGEARDHLLSAFRALDNSLQNTIGGFPAEAASELDLGLEFISLANPILQDELGVETALNDCGAEIWYAGVDDLISEFIDLTEGVTVDTFGSEEIRTGIFELQRIRREMDVFFPDCVTTAASHLALSVDAGIGFFQAIMANDSEDKARQITIMTRERDAFFVEMNTLNVPVIIE